MEFMKLVTIAVLAGAVGLLLGVAMNTPPVRSYSTYVDAACVPAVQTPRGRASERVQGVEGLESRTGVER